MNPSQMRWVNKLGDLECSPAEGFMQWPCHQLENNQPACTSADWPNLLSGRATCSA